MPRFNIEQYLRSLPDNTTYIDVSSKCIYELPDITRFMNLQHLDCDNNNLTSLPALPESLIYLSCHRNNLRSLPALPANLQYLYCCSNPLRSLPLTLPENLVHLYCASNKLTSLPALPANLLHLLCTDNKLNSLPKLPESLQYLHCGHNILTSMPMLPESISSFGYCFNPIWENQRQIICNHNPGDQSSLHITIKQINTYNSFRNLYAGDQSSIVITIKQINTYNSFRHLYYSLKFKNQFRNWLWEKVRRPKIENQFHPKYLIANLNEDDDLDQVIDRWVQPLDTCF